MKLILALLLVLPMLAFADDPVEGGSADVQQCTDPLHRCFNNTANIPVTASAKSEITDALTKTGIVDPNAQKPDLTNSQPVSK